jgi:hypothetical protein
MKMRFPLIAALALAVTIVACNDMPVAPDVNFELIDGYDRVEEVNRHVYGEFVFELEGTGGVTAILDGPGNWQGNLPRNAPSNANWCVDGVWFNPQGRKTAGAVDQPHPHCTQEGSETVYVILEPISAYYDQNPGGNIFLEFTTDGDQVKRVGSGRGMHTEGQGVLEAHAVLRDDPTQRVGVIRFDLGDYTGTDTQDLFNCTYSYDAEGEPDSGCLNHMISFDYTPNADGTGVGVATTGQQGFLWWKAATDYFRAN